MILCVLVAFMNFANLTFAAAELSTDQKANVLNKLTILQGDGIDYNLKGPLKRSEASTFIVRIMGKEGEVKSNTPKYSNTPFSDVKPDDWFAPYVGYCVEQNIINGFPDGSYRPGESVSEKAFLKLVLGSLGYREGTDFTWDNVYNVAYTIGLITGSNQHQTEDNTQYTRADVVNALYYALTKPFKGTNKTIIQTLIADKIVSRSAALELGLVKDSIQTTIQTAISTSSTSIGLKLNEAIEKITSDNVQVYETGNKANKLSVSITQQSGSELILSTSEQKPDQAYTVELVNVVDTEGNPSASLTASFQGYLPPKVDSVSVVNETKLSLTFNKGVSKIKAESIKIYETGKQTNTLPATIDSQTDKTLVLKTGLQKQDQNYTIELSGLEEKDEAPLSIMATFVGFKIPEVKSDLFKISKVVPVSKNIINVYFTQRVNSNGALPFFYEVLKDNVSFVKGNFTNMSVKTLSQNDNVISILLKGDSIAAIGTYTLKVSGEMTGLYGVNLNDGLGDSAVFAANAAENENLNVAGLSPVNPRTLRLDFNKDIDLQSAQQMNNYLITTANNVPIPVVKVTPSADNRGRSLLLTIAGTFDKGMNYDLTIKNISDSFNQIILPETKLPFTGQGMPETKSLQIINVTPIDSSTIQVYFDRVLDSQSATTNALYSIVGVTNSSFSSYVQSVYFDPNQPYAVKVYLPSGTDISASQSYKLRVSNQMLDEVGNPSASQAEYTFSGSSDSNTKPLIYEAKIIGKDTVLVKTNKGLSPSSPSNNSANNYWLESKDNNNTTTTKSAISVGFIDVNTVVLKFDPLDYSKSYTLKFNSLTDFSLQYVRTASDGFTSIGVTAIKNQ